MPSTLRVAASALAGAVAVSAHGYATGLVANGVWYEGYDVNSAPYAPEPPVVVGWGTSATDQGFVAPDAFNTPDIICHRDSTNAAGHATVAAGESVFIKWNTWPESHKGPVIDYLAACNGECSSADKTSLSFVKIAEKGLISGSNPGTWAADELISNGNSWTVEIPSSIAPGKYVLRHEILALHASGQPNGAQAYPQCVNLEITGSGSTTPSGEPATSFYTASDPGILFNLYESFSSYDIPGPALFSG
jgi:cellulase